MPTNLAIDDQLLNEALRLGGHHSKKDTVNEALRLYIAGKKQKEILKLMGQLDADPNYHYKKLRKRS